MATSDFNSHPQSAQNGADHCGSHPEAPDSAETLFTSPVLFPEAIDHARLPGAAIRSFITSVAEIAGGCRVLSDLLMQEASDDAHRSPDDPHSPPRIFNNFHRGQLHLLLSGSMTSLSREAEKLANWAYDIHTEEGRQEAEQRALLRRPGGPFAHSAAE